MLHEPDLKLRTWTSNPLKKTGPARQLCIIADPQNRAKILNSRKTFHNGGPLEYCGCNIGRVQKGLKGRKKVSEGVTGFKGFKSV